MVRSRANTTNRVTSRATRQPGSKGKAQTTSFYVQPGPSRSKSKAVRIDVPPQTFKALFAEPERFRKLFEGYGKALVRSRATGKKVRFEVAVEPEGAPKIIPIEETATADVVAASTIGSGADLERALAAARERGRIRIAEIMNSPEMLTADDFAARLGTTRATVNTWRQKHQVLGLEGAKRGFRFPTWQIGEDGKPFAVLPELFERLGGVPWAVYRFLIQHHPELDGLTAQEALRRGRDKDVLETAENVGRTFS
jgi:DNA-binding transcriptional regulator YiaG